MSKTKKSLLLSCLSMLLCVTMLIGSTFAWFTDNASTGLNSIQAGTLDIDVQYTQDGMSWSYLENATNLFEGALWEPGHTRVVALKVTNNGSLALKYQMGMNIVSETTGINVYGDSFKLSDYLEVSTLAQQANGIGEAALSVAFQDENAVGYEYTNKLSEVKRENHLLPGDSHYLFIKVDMPETVGNEANAQPGSAASIQFGINILATQLAYESDSFGSSYDADANFTDVVVVKEATDEAFAAAVASVEAGGTVVLPEGVYTIPTSAGGKEFTVSGTKKTVIVINTVNTNAGGADVTFKGVTINGQESGDYAGLGNGCNVSFVDCIIKGKISLYGENASFVNCTFNNQNDYSVWTWGGKDVDFIGCTFNSGGKALLVYGEYVQTNIDIIDCTFYDDNTLDTDKAAIEIGSNRDTDTHNINIKNVTVNGFAAGANTGSTIWANKNSMPTDRLNVVIDGVDVY